MKVSKRVNDEGHIEVEFEGIPEMPNRDCVLPFIRDGYSVSKTACRIDSARIGDLVIDYKACEMETDYKKTDRAEMIAAAIQNRISYAWVEWKKFVETNTESIEVTDRDRFVAECDANHRLLYRGKDGKFHEIK
jgi:hypothetical protein